MQQDREQTIIKKLRNKDKKTIHSFYRLHKGPLMSFLITRLGSHSDCEEVMQDSFIAFFEGLRDFQGKSSVKTYLFSIAKHKAIDKLRKRRVKRVLFSHLPRAVVENLATVLLDDEIDRVQLSQKIERVLSTLPRQYVNILRLKYWESKPVSEIARDLKLSFKATESLLFRARKAFTLAYQNI